jgi:hypothetical protein
LIPCFASCHGFLPAVVFAILVVNGSFIESAEPAAPNRSEFYLGKPLDYWAGQAAASQPTEDLDTILDALSQAFQSGDLNTMVAAADAMQALGSKASSRAKLLTEVLDHIQPWVRTAAMDALAAMGSHSVPALVEAFETGPAGTRVRARWCWARSVPTHGRPCRHSKPQLDRDRGHAASAGRHHRRDSRPGGNGAADRPAAASFRSSDEAAFVAVAAKTDDWPQFRGPGRDGISAETGLLSQWPEDGPLAVAARRVGQRLFERFDRRWEDLHDGRPERCRRGRAPVRMAFDLDTRDELWATRVGPPHSDGPRCTPTWDDGSCTCWEPRAICWRCKPTRASDLAGAICRTISAA